MARIRTIKPEFPQSESMGRVSREARLCFIQLWTLADDSGRLRGNSRMLASLLYPYDDDAPALIGGWLDELEKEGCVQRYQLDGDRYLAVCAWGKHQKIDKPTASKLPAPLDSSRGFANVREVSSGDQGVGKGSLDQGADHSSPVGESGGFEQFWETYPRKEGKAAARKAFDKLKPDKALLAQMLAAVAVQRMSPGWVKDGGQFIPHPATWLNGKRWEDASPAATAPHKHGGFEARDYRRGVSEDGTLRI
jgi:hypothetical protein